MQHIPLLVLFVLLYGFTSALPVSAKIYINEFSSAESEDWIELYNDGEEDVLLSGYQLRDNTEHKKDLDGTLGGQGFTVIEWNWLNAGEDTIRLFNADTSVDEVFYGTSTIPAPEKGQSVGRTEDGQGNWSIFSAHSAGSSNSESEVYTPPEPTPSRTPTPSKSPTPSRTPSPSKTPVPTKISTPHIISVTSYLNTDITISISPTTEHVQSSEAAVLGSGDLSRVPSNPADSSENSHERKTRTLGAVQSNTGGLAVIVAGILLLSSCGILLFRRYKYLLFR